MPQLSRHYCTDCRTSIHNCVIDGQRVPVVVQIVFGQPADTGEPLDLAAPGVQVPSVVREIMDPAVPSARMELCMACFAKRFGLALVTADADPMRAAKGGAYTAEELSCVDATERCALQHARTLHAVEVGRGAQAASAFVAPTPSVRPPEPPELPAPAASPS